MFGWLLNPIPTGLGHVTLIYGLIPPMAGRNRVNYYDTLGRLAFVRFLEEFEDTKKTFRN